MRVEKRSPGSPKANRGLPSPQIMSTRLSQVSHQMDGFQTIIYHKAEGIAYISLNRPRVLNVYNVEMRDELYQVLGAVKEDQEIGVAIFSGVGQAFCAGADLTEFGTAPSLTMARKVRWERDIWGTLLSIPKPLIAAIHGYCLGSGLELALLCDIRIAAEDAAFGMPEVGLGLIPAAGGTQTLPRLLGIPRAMELLLTRRRVGAAEALELGLVSRVVRRESLASEAESTARSLLSMDQQAVKATKEAVLHGAELALEEALDLEARLALRVSVLSAKWLYKGWHTD